METLNLPCTKYQREFLWAILVDTMCEKVGFGGARGGGKTFISVLAMVLRRLMFARSKGLMLRRTQGAADENLGEEIRNVIEMLGLPIGKTKGGCYWNVQAKTWNFPNGSSIRLGYCKNDNDWERYQGAEYMDLAFEEATQFKEKAYLDITGSGRQTKHKGVTSKTWITCNPGGIGTPWVEKRYIDAKSRDRRTIWIKALLKENMAMLDKDPGYRDRILAMQPEWRRKQWEDGDWEAVEGQFFQIDTRCIRTMEVPYYADLYCGVDAGYYPSSFAVVWVAKWKDYGTGKIRVHVWKELKKQRLDAFQQANEALAIDKLIKTHAPKGRFADPAAWKRTEASTDGLNSSVAMAWASKGFLVTAAYSNARQAGWLLMRTLMNQYSLTIDPECYALLTEVNDAVHDDKTDDIKEGCEDHLLDALRYCLMTIFSGSAPSRDDTTYNTVKAKENTRLQKLVRIPSKGKVNRE